MQLPITACSDGSRHLGVRLVSSVLKVVSCQSGLLFRDFILVAWFQTCTKLVAMFLKCRHNKTAKWLSFHSVDVMWQINAFAPLVLSHAKTRGGGCSEILAGLFSTKTTAPAVIELSPWRFLFSISYLCLRVFHYLERNILPQSPLSIISARRSWCTVSNPMLWWFSEIL